MGRIIMSSSTCVNPPEPRLQAQQSTGPEVPIRRHAGPTFRVTSLEESSLQKNENEGSPMGESLFSYIKEMCRYYPIP